jgi:hypothetical protein
MPRGPKGQKRPADVIGNAVRVMRIAIGEQDHDADEWGALPPAGRLPIIRGDFPDRGG